MRGYITQLSEHARIITSCKSLISCNFISLAIISYNDVSLPHSSSKTTDELHYGNYNETRCCNGAFGDVLNCQIKSASLSQFHCSFNEVTARICALHTLLHLVPRYMYWSIQT